MDLIKVEHYDVVRLYFGSKSFSFRNTTPKEVFDTAMKAFKEVKINKTIELKNCSVFDSPKSELCLRITARIEASGNKKAKFIKGNSKSKTIYGLTAEEAKDIFLKYYEKHIQK